MIRLVGPAPARVPTWKHRRLLATTGRPSSRTCSLWPSEVAMLWLRRLVGVLVLCAVLAPASVASAQQTVSSGAPDPALLKDIESQVGQIRGLQPLVDSQIRLIDHVALKDYL